MVWVPHPVLIKGYISGNSLENYTSSWANFNWGRLRWICVKCGGSFIVNIIIPTYKDLTRWSSVYSFATLPHLNLTSATIQTYEDRSKATVSSAAPDKMKASK